MISGVSLPDGAMQGIQGTAPNVATLALATQIDLPRQMDNVRITNLEATAVMKVAFSADGPELSIPGASGSPGSNELASFQGTVSSVWVRGVSATAAFRMTFTNANPR